MRKALLTILISLTAVFAAYSQTVDEAKTRVYFEGNDLVTKLSINSDRNYYASLKLELLNPNDTVKIAKTQDAYFLKGADVSEVRIPFGYLRDVDDLIWKRLRYTIVTGPEKNVGLISLSQVMPDLFELRGASSEYVSAGSTYVVRVNSVNPVTGAPVPHVELKAKLKIELEDEDADDFVIETEGITDATGFATLLFTVPEGIKPERDYGDAVVEIVGSRNGVYSRTSEDIDIMTAGFKVMINTDKPLYQPGQSIFIRGLAAEDKAGKNFGKPIPDTDLEFTISDGDNTTLYRETVKTSRFGIASIKWQIPDNAKLGQYSIEVEIGDTEASDYSSFKVSRYELPNFVVNTKSDKDYYLPKDKTAKVKVDSAYLFGKPVAAGKVKVVRESNREWNFEKQEWNITEEEKYEGTSDKDGIYEASIDLKDAHKDLAEDETDKFKDISYTAYYTDSTTNITEQRRFDLRISKEDIHVYFIGINDDDHNDKLPLRFFVTTFLADGTPVEADVEIKGAFEDEGKRKTLTKVKTNKYGAARVEVKLPKCPDGFCSGDDFEMEAIAKDSKKRTGKELKDEISIDEDEKEIQIKTSKTIFKTGEAVGVEIVSSEQKRRVMVDVLKGRSVLSTHEVDVNNGTGKLTIPYRPDFENALTIHAYYNDDGDTVRTTSGIIYPKPVALDVKAETDAEIYRPAKDVELKYGITSPSGPSGETALGVYVMDRAVEERALTDSNFGGGFDPFSDYRSSLGYSRGFGGVSEKDLNELDLSKPVSPDLELAAAIMLKDNYNSQEFYDGDLITPEGEFNETIKDQLSFVSLAMRYRYSLDYFHPTDQASFERIMKENGIDFSEMRDPWGSPYRVKFSIYRDNSIVTIISNGPNKTDDSTKDDSSHDDFTALETRYNYFTEMGQKIDTALNAYTVKNGAFIRDEETFAGALGESEIEIKNLKDRWGRSYKYSFEAEGRNYQLRITSDGPTLENKYDGFRIWTHSTDYFVKHEQAISKMIEDYTIENKTFPKDGAEFKKILKDGGADFESLRDGWGRAYYLESKTEKVFADRVTIETVSNAAGGKEDKYIVTPVTREVGVITIRSHGENGEKETYEWRKPHIARFAGVISEQVKEDAKPKVIVPKTAFADGKAAIYGVVTDQTGAVIPGANVTAIYLASGTEITQVADASGSFLIGNLPAGSYKLRIESPGFQVHILNGIELAGESVVEVNASLEVGGVSMIVEVTAGVSVTIDSSSASISTERETFITNYWRRRDRPTGSLALPARGVLNGDEGEKFEFSYYSIEGASGAENTLVIDGQRVTDLRRGQINVVTKSGSNDGTKTDPQRKETPRIRNYFPETLLWAPEIITDEKGNSIVKFTLADNITTWKIYTIASNLEGRIGVSEKEIKTFQPFFVDLLPPRVLTKGDEISLPVQVRNYTEKTQDVEVKLRDEKWFEVFKPDPKTAGAAFVRPNDSKVYPLPESAMLNVAANKAGSAASSGNSGVPVKQVEPALSSTTSIVKVAANSTENAIFNYRATERIEDGLMNVTAVADGESDGIEKPVTVKPDGKEVTGQETRIFTNTASFDVNYPANALDGTHEAELKIYPNLFAHVSESVEGLLQRPYGCGEQTVSSTYPNLMILKFTKSESALRTKAQGYLQKGYERLRGYQVEGGGFSYWGGNDKGDIALTAYALRFLSDASEFIDVDELIMRRAKAWLAARQASNGLWTTLYGSETEASSRRTWMISTYVVRAMASTVNEEDSGVIKTALERGFLALARENQKIDEPYSLANLGLAYKASGQDEKANEIAVRLRSMAKRENDTFYWKLETNTPFFGWGTPGRIETTAVVLQLLQKTTKEQGDRLISDGIANILRLKDRYGVWYSTQATINVLEALLVSIDSEIEKDDRKHTAGIFVNGAKVADIELPPANEPGYPLTADISKYVDQTSNRVEVRTEAKQVLQAQVVANHFIDWDDFETEDRDINSSRQLALDYGCDRYQAAPTDEITCKVKAERVGFKGYGMLLAEIGLPPGADVDRATLDKAVKDDWSFSRYDVLPDRIVIYMWSKAGGTEFDFKFKPRYGINAQTPASFVYDYYNEDAKAVVKPMRFEIR